eukprot:416851-Prymnesium_polylepis.1
MGRPALALAMARRNCSLLAVAARAVSSRCLRSARPRSGLLGLWGCGSVSSPVIVPVRCLRA